MRSLNSAGDAALMRAFARRDHGAAEELYGRFSSRVYGLGIVMLGSDAAAQDLVGTADLAARARRAMDGLTGEQRAALELAYFSGKTSAEVAELEGIPLGTAKT